MLMAALTTVVDTPFIVVGVHNVIVVPETVKGYPENVLPEEENAQPAFVSTLQTPA